MAGYGPETITAHQLNNGRYRFRVSEYHGGDDNSQRLLDSEALVTVYTALGTHVFPVGKPGTGFVKVKKVSIALCELLPVKMYMN